MSLHETPTSSNWNAVLAIALSVAFMVAVELLPLSLLAPMAEGLQVTEGMAGQSLTAMALAAVFASLTITTITRGIDRRCVVIGFAILLVISSLIVATAHNYWMMLVGRVLLGFALGGFWALAASLAMRLVPSPSVPKALSVMFGGVSVALVGAAPAGSYLGAIIGWRGVFATTACFGVVCLVWLLNALPKMPSNMERPASVRAVFSVLSNPGAFAGMLGVFGTYGGQFALLTYTRPYYERAAGFPIEGVSAVLLVFGVSNFVGTLFSSRIIARGLLFALAVPTPLIAACALAFAYLSTHPTLVVAITIVWGLALGVVLVAWSAWVANRFPNDAENAGGLQVATVQLANTAGAAIGGMFFYAVGPNGPLMLGATVMLGTFSMVASLSRSLASRQS